MTSRGSLLLLLLALPLGAATCASVNENGLGTGAGGATGAGGSTGAAGNPFGTPITTTGGAGTAPAGTAGMSGAAGTPAAPHACVNLECRQTSCTLGNCAAPKCGAQQTTLSGTIYDPAGRLPLYNVALYVPNAALDPIAEGVTCDRCAGKSSGQPIASTITDANGHFVLKNPPVGKDVPLVIQVGKWRREVRIPEIAACQDTPLTDKDLTRLPRSRAEGHLPRIAITTGHADALECLLRKIGIADTEFTTEKGDGRVHLFVGGEGGQDGDGQGANSFMSGEALPAAATLWGDPARLMKYDMLVLSCEGSTFGKAKMPYLGNIKAYADRGGRIFDDHLHFYWLQKGPAPWPDTAEWLGDDGDLNSITAKIDTTFPKGVAFSDWLVNVAATPTRGEIAIEMAQHSVADHHRPTSQRWIYLDDPKAVQYLTFNTPVEKPEAEQCGRVVFTDIHVSSVGGASDVSHPETPFPSGCTTTTLSPQEKALEFMLFDLSSCVQEDIKPPAPPPIIE